MHFYVSFQPHLPKDNHEDNPENNAMTATTQLPKIPEADKTEIEAAVFRKMLEHFSKHPEVQNIELMNLAYFCRNCFSKWYMSAAQAREIELDYEQAREIIYGMPFAEYKSRFQEKASEEQLAKLAQSQHKASE